MTSIDDIIGKAVNKKNFDDTVNYDVVNHRFMHLKDAVTFMNLIMNDCPSKNPEMYDVYRKDGSFAYHAVIEYQLPKYHDKDSF